MVSTSNIIVTLAMSGSLQDTTRLWDVVEYMKQFVGEELEEVMASLPVPMERLHCVECCVSDGPHIVVSLLCVCFRKTWIKESLTL